MWRVKGRSSTTEHADSDTHTQRERETNKSTHAVCESVRGSLPEAVPPKSEKAGQHRVRGTGESRNQESRDSRQSRAE